jgi:lysophospholipase L1-like esterase
LDTFIQRYEQSIDKFKELQPGAVIYIQGIMRVTKEKSESDAIFNNEGIIERNERIAELADNETVFYIDMNEAVCDKEGNLKESLTFDNLHLYGSKYGVWVDFLKTKGLQLD